MITLSEIYNVFNNRRGKAVEGLIRPTVGQVYRSGRNFIERLNITPLTWSGSTHSEQDVLAAGGVVFDTGSGTIGRFSGNAPPSGWTQAGNWQRYSVSYWGGDPCGNHRSSGPSSWSNSVATQYIRGGFKSMQYWDCSYTYRMYWFGPSSGGNAEIYNVSGPYYNSTTNRVEIGAY